MSGDGFAIHRLSSQAVPRDARVAACREYFGAPMVGLEFAPRDEEKFDVDVAFGLLPEIRVGRGRFRRFGIGRVRERIAADDRRDFALIIAGGGRHRAVQLGREAEFGAGEAVLTTDAEPAWVDYGAGGGFIILQPSHRALTALAPGCEDALARRIPAGNEALRLIAGYAALVLRDATLTAPGIGHLAAVHLLDLVALAIGTTRELAARAKGRGLAAARLAAIRADVERNLTRPELSIGAVAGRLGVSPRYVARLLAGEGTTFSDLVRNRRLEQARRLLIDPRAAHLAIGAIAYECGFSDLSYFNRCFRARYDASPGETRNR